MRGGEARRGRYAAHAEDKGGQIPLWLITFTDVMALMLTFFVLMYAMSAPDEDKWKEVTRGLNRELVSSPSMEWYEAGPQEISIGRLAPGAGLNLGYLRTVVESLIARDPRLEGVELIPRPDYLIVSLPSDLLFAPGSAGISEKGQVALSALGNALARIRNRVEIVGHTAPPPVETAGWELSLARAASVAAALERAGYEKPVVVRGLSNGRYADMPPATPEDLRLSLARRVDILIMRDDGSRKSLLQFDRAAPADGPGDAPQDTPEGPPEDAPGNSG